MKAYPEYKASGIDWLGDIPSHWEMSRVKYVVTCNNEVLPESTDKEQEINYVEISDVSFEKGVEKSTIIKFGEAPSRARRVTKIDDVIISTVRTYLKAIAKIKVDNLIVSTGFAVLHPQLINPHFLFYSLSTSGFLEEVESHSTGVSYPAITATDLVNLSITLPPVAEQEAIAAYLDEVTGKIDALMAEKQTQINELRAYRTSLITEAVTRGLNPNAPLKDTGIDWLGDIPQHWENIKLKFLLDEPMMYGANESPESDINIDNPRYIRITDIDENGNLKDETYRTLQYDKAHPYLLKYGDVLFARSGATVGKTYRFTECYPACFAGYLIKASCGRKLLSSFLIYYTNSQSYNNWKNSIFDQSTIQNIAADKYNNLSVPLPPLSEQKAIAEFLDKKTTKIDALIAELEAQLKDLTDYKQAIITEAVTGKVDVRDWKHKN